MVLRLYNFFRVKKWKCCLVVAVITFTVLCSYARHRMVFTTRLYGSSYKYFHSARGVDSIDKSYYSQQPRAFVNCHNTLSNLTNGSWVLASLTEEKHQDDNLKSFWNRNRLLEKLWRNDGKCGNKNYLPKMNGSDWPNIPALCDAHGTTPCCDNLKDGTCRSPGSSNCQCKDCLDMRRFLHAEASEWKTRDPACQWKYFRGKEACDVIESSEFSHLQFVGDSYIRNMFITFLMLLSDDTERGAWGVNMNYDQMELCRKDGHLFHKECRYIVRNSQELRYPEKMCGGNKPNFTVSARITCSDKGGPDFVNTTRDLAGKRGKLILVGLGIHMRLDADFVISQILEPGLQARDKFYLSSKTPVAHRWPRIIFIMPMPPGLLKPTRYLPHQNNEKLSRFTDKLSSFCLKKHIPFFDFRPLAAYVHSFDGSHYGIGVNMMKNQVFLNHLSSLEKYET